MIVLIVSISILFSQFSVSTVSYFVYNVLINFLLILLLLQHGEEGKLSAAYAAEMKNQQSARWSFRLFSYTILVLQTYDLVLWSLLYFVPLWFYVLLTHDTMADMCHLISIATVGVQISMIWKSSTIKFQTILKNKGIEKNQVFYLQI